MTWVLVQNGKAHELFAQQPVFHPDLMASVIEYLGPAEVGWTLQNGEFVTFVIQNAFPPGPYFDKGALVEVSKVGPVVTLNQTWVAWDQTRIDAVRDDIKAKLDNAEDILRAFALLVLEDRNLLAAKLNGIRTLTINNATYAAYRTAITAAEATPIYTEAQLLTAIKNKLGT